MTYEERQQARHQLGRRLTFAGMAIVVLTALLGMYVRELPPGETAWYEVLVVCLSPVGAPLGRIAGLIVCIIGQMYRIDAW